MIKEFIKDWEDFSYKHAGLSVLLAIVSLSMIFAIRAEAEKIYADNAPGVMIKTVDEPSRIVEEQTDEPVDDGWVVHRVRNGETLYTIARRYLTNAENIKEWNGLKKTGVTLKAGQELLIKKIKLEPYEGLASWYGPGFHGRRMANGEIYNMNEVLVAHRRYPFGTELKITNLDNGRSIVAPVKDRGPYIEVNGRYTREIDLSSAAADLLGTKHKGVVRVKIESQ